MYIFRNGIRIKTGAGVDSSTIAITFIKKDYGDINDDYTIVDIGANIGVYSIFAVSESKNTTVYAYEPMLSSFNLLMENIRINGLEKYIFPFNIGVCDRKEKRKLYLGKDSSSHSLYLKGENEQYVEIECLALKDIFDDNNIERCDILKLNCEGAEFDIFYNTPDKYFMKIREIRFECHDRGSNGNYNKEELINFLKKKGFGVRKFKRYSEHSANLWLSNIR